MSRGNPPSRRARELRVAFSAAGIAIEVLELTRANHVRIISRRGPAKAITTTGLTPGDRRNILNAVGDARRELRAQGADL